MNKYPPVLGDEADPVSLAKERTKNFPFSKKVFMVSTPTTRTGKITQELEDCDAVFERSAQASAAHGATLETNQARAGALCEELERIAAMPGEALLASVPQLNELSAEFESLELPRASARALKSGPPIYTASAPWSMAVMPMAALPAGDSSSRAAVIYLHSMPLS